MMQAQVVQAQMMQAGGAGTGAAGRGGAVRRCSHTGGVGRWRRHRQYIMLSQAEALTDQTPPNTTVFYTINPSDKRALPITVVVKCVC